MKRALERDRIIDITTVGRHTGLPRRIEIWFYRVDGHLYLSGAPGRRGWYANLLHNPEFTFHLKESARADLLARATAIVDVEQRREIIRQILENIGAWRTLRPPFPRSWFSLRNLEAWVANSPLVEIMLEEET